MVPVLGGVQGDLVKGWVGEKMMFGPMMLGDRGAWNQTCFQCQVNIGKYKVFD